MPHPRLRLAAVLLSAFALLATSGGCAQTPQRLLDLYGGQAAYNLVAQPTGDTEVTAYRILPPHLADEVAAPPGAIQLHGHLVLAGPVPVDAATRDQLSDVLGDDGTYDWDRAKGCEFMPGVAIRWRQGDLTVDTLLCFSCDEVGIHRNDKWQGTEDFDRRRAALVRAAKSLFPHDAKLQSLQP